MKRDLLGASQSTRKYKIIFSGLFGLMSLLLLQGCVSISIYLYEKKFTKKYDPSHLSGGEEQLLGASAFAGERSPQERNPVLFSRKCSLAAAISGGGSISAAFSYGVLRELAAMRDLTADTNQIPSVLAQLDYISTASGGGITGALLSSLLMNDFPSESTPAETALKIEKALDKSQYQQMLSEKFISTKYIITHNGDGRLLRFREHLPFTLFQLAKQCSCTRLISYERMFRDQKTVAPLWIANATSYADGRRIPMTLHNLHALGIASFPSPRDPRLFECVGASPTPEKALVTEGLAASMSFPGIGPYRLAAGSESLDLVDGGLSDNTGMKTALDAVAADLGVDLATTSALPDSPEQQARAAQRGVVIVIDSSLDAEPGVRTKSHDKPNGDDYVKHLGSLGLAAQYPEVERYGTLVRHTVQSVSAEARRPTSLQVIHIRARDVLRYPSSAVQFKACDGLRPEEKEAGLNSCTPERPQKFATDPQTILDTFRTSAAISYQDADVLMQLGRFLARQQTAAIRQALSECL